MKSFYIGHIRSDVCHIDLVSAADDVLVYLATVNDTVEVLVDASICLYRVARCWRYS